MIFVAAGMEQPPFIPLTVRNEAKIVTILAGVIILLCYAGWLLWKVAMAFRQYPGWCSAATLVWGAIYYGYMHSELTKNKFGLAIFVAAGGLGFVLLASGVIRSVELKAKREGVEEERQHYDISHSPPAPREITTGNRLKDVP